MRWIPLLLALSLNAFATPKPSLAASEKEALLLKQYPELKSECESKGLEILTIQDQLVTSCKNHCGQGGCPFRIYLLDKKRYRKIAEFFGHYKVLSTASNGLYDISVTGFMGRDMSQNFVMKFDGRHYQ